MTHPGGRPTLSQVNGKAQLAGLFPGVGDTLSSGVLLALTYRPARSSGERAAVGVALVFLPENRLHPFVVWSVAAGNGQPLYVSGGDYCLTLEQAWRIYRSRGIRL